MLNNSIMLSTQFHNFTTSFYSFKNLTIKQIKFSKKNKYKFGNWKLGNIKLISSFYKSIYCQLKSRISIKNVPFVKLGLKYFVFIEQIIVKNDLQNSNFFHASHCLWRVFEFAGEPKGGLLFIFIFRLFFCPVMHLFLNEYLYNLYRLLQIFR